MAVKEAELAGSWYGGDARTLAAEVDACVDGAKRGYDPVPGGADAVPAAVVVPHAGLAFSGAVAAAAFVLIRERIPHVDTFLVFGACHRVRLSRPAVWPDGVWKTPLGDIAVDAALAELLVDRDICQPGVRPFMGDNAVELQTPFIKRLFPEAALTPVAMPFLPDAWRLGELAAAAAEGMKRTIVAVASTDLTHYGAAFGVTPAGTGEAALEWTRRNDGRFLDALTAMRLEDIVPVASRDGSACGAGAAAATAGWAAERGCRSGRILAHTNSHLVMPQGEADHIVGYASVAYEKVLLQ